VSNAKLVVSIQTDHLFELEKAEPQALFCLAYAPLIIIDNLLTVFVCILLQRKMLWVSVCKTS
jgi:hypothetical protein